MISNKEKRILKEMYYDLDRALESKGWGNLVGKLYKMEVQAEREHREFRGPYSCTISDAARYFTVKHVLDGLKSRLKVADYLHTRQECFYGEALATEYRTEITAVFPPERIELFESTFDYVRMVEPETESA